MINVNVDQRPSIFFEKCSLLVVNVESHRHCHSLISKFTPVTKGRLFSSEETLSCIHNFGNIASLLGRIKNSV